MTAVGGPVSSFSSPPRAPTAVGREEKTKVSKKETKKNEKKKSRVEDNPVLRTGHSRVRSGFRRRGVGFAPVSAVWVPRSSQVLELISSRWCLLSATRSAFPSKQPPLELGTNLKRKNLNRKRRRWGVVKTKYEGRFRERICYKRLARASVDLRLHRGHVSEAAFFRAVLLRGIIPSGE